LFDRLGEIYLRANAEDTAGWTRQEIT